MVHIEWAHESIKKFWKLLFLEFRKDDQLLKTEMGVSETAVCHPTPIYLLSTTLQIQIIGYNTAQLTFIYAVGRW